ncbi:hypothetical protein LB503_009347 [Fusarium chuoi]|nr:hypothetical protein LB503_009347 [Fusarium chuoi]
MMLLFNPYCLQKDTRLEPASSSMRETSPSNKHVLRYLAMDSSTSEPSVCRSQYLHLHHHGKYNNPIYEPK